jgi:hypothetical protein
VLRGKLRAIRRPERSSSRGGNPPEKEASYKLVTKAIQFRPTVNKCSSSEEIGTGFNCGGKAIRKPERSEPGGSGGQPSEKKAHTKV